MTGVAWHLIASFCLSPLASLYRPYNRLLERAVHSTEEELSTGSVQADMMITHKYAEEVPVTVRVDMGGRQACRPRHHHCLHDAPGLLARACLGVTASFRCALLACGQARRTSGCWCCP